MIPIAVGKSRLAIINSKRNDLIKNEPFRRSVGFFWTPAIFGIALCSWNVQAGPTEIVKFLIFFTLISIQPLDFFFCGGKRPYKPFAYQVATVESIDPKLAKRSFRFFRIGVCPYSWSTLSWLFCVTPKMLGTMLLLKNVQWTDEWE